MQIWAQVTELRRHVVELGLQHRITVDVLDARDLAAALSWDFDTFVNNAAIGGSGHMAINPGPYETGFNDRIADTTYRGPGTTTRSTSPARATSRPTSARSWQVSSTRRT